MVRISDPRSDTSVRLLEMLEANGRATFSELARRLGVSEAAVRKRVKRLEREGVIKGYSARVDPKKLGFEIHAVIGMDVKPDKLISVIRSLKEMKPKSLYLCGGDHSVLFEAWFRNSGELERFVETVESLEGVSRVCPSVLLEKIV